MKSKAAVLIHGYHLEAHGWESVVWGDLEKDVWGVIPRGVEYAWRTKADLIVWGTGASERDGKKEAEVMYERGIEGIDELARICGTKPKVLKEFLESRSFQEADSKDTNSEMRNTLELCLRRDITNVTCVIAASHAPLAARRALWMVLEDESPSTNPPHIHNLTLKNLFSPLNGDITQQHCEKTMG